MKSYWLAALLAVSACTSVARAQTVSVDVGGKQVAVAIPGPLERASIAAPTIFSIYQAALPTTHRLIEAFVARDDIERTLAGEDAEGVIYQLQVMRNVERMALTQTDWVHLRPELRRQMASLDVGALAAGLESAASKRLSDAAGVPVDLAFGEPGRMQLYGEDPGSVRFSMLMSVKTEVAGQHRAVEGQVAGAALPVGNRLLFLYAMRRHRPGEDASVVRAALDRWVEATVAVDPK